MKWGLALLRLLPTAPLAFFILFPLAAASQNADSLRALLPGASGESRARILNELAEAFLYDDPASARKYADEALNIALSLGGEKQEAASRTLLGEVYFNTGENKKALAEFELAEKIYRKLDNKEQLQGVLNGIGLVNSALGNSNRTLQCFTEALRINEELNNNKGLSNTLNNMGNFYYAQEEYQKAVDYFSRSLEIDISLNDLEMQGFSYSNIGSIYDEMGKTEKAIENHRKALEVRRQFGSKIYISRSLNNLANALTSAGRHDEAEANYLESLQMKREHGVKSEIAVTLNNIGHFYTKTGQHNKGLEYLTEARTMADSLDDKDILVTSLEWLADAQAGMGKYEQAYETYKAMRHLNDSLRKDYWNTELADMREKYDSEQKESENKLLRLENEDYDRKMSAFWAWITVVVLLLVAVVIVAAISLRTAVMKSRLNAELESRNNLIQQKNEEIEKQRDLLEKQNQQIRKINTSLEKLVEERTANLVETNRELDTFLYESTHALRRPLLRILALFQLIEKETDPEERTRLSRNVDVTTRSMNLLFQKLIQVNEINHRTPEITGVSLRKSADAALENLAQAARYSHAKVSFEIPADDVIPSDPYFLNAILWNLLENALMYTSRISRPAEISVAMKKENGKIRVWIRDNGAGIPENVRGRVFEMFYRGTENSLGSGLGLFVVKKACDKLGIEATVISKENEFTEVTLRFNLGTTGADSNSQNKV